MPARILRDFDQHVFSKTLSFLPLDSLTELKCSSKAMNSRIESTIETDKELQSQIHQERIRKLDQELQVRREEELCAAQPVGPPSPMPLLTIPPTLRSLSPRSR